ncbi:MAG TPA: hypothetical protein VFP43_14410 [Mesorhizobium sp.]|jgi:hypothetical protein|nr:hypothetical protein [Mesorhizobium sp.]
MIRAAVTRCILCLSVLSLTAGEALAQTRIQTTGTSCAKLQGALARAGIAMLQYRSLRNPSLPLFDQYVASEQYCDVDEVVAVRTVPTADTAACPVRKCVSIHRAGRRK